MKGFITIVIAFILLLFAAQECGKRKRRKQMDAVYAAEYDLTQNFFDKYPNATNLDDHFPFSFPYTKDKQDFFKPGRYVGSMIVYDQEKVNNYLLVEGNINGFSIILLSDKPVKKISAVAFDLDSLSITDDGVYIHGNLIDAIMLQDDLLF